MSKPRLKNDSIIVQLLYTLAYNGGSIFDSDGGASRRLLTWSKCNITMGMLSNYLRQMEKRQEIIRDINGKRTYKITITDNGLSRIRQQFPEIFPETANFIKMGGSNKETKGEVANFIKMDRPKKATKSTEIKSNFLKAGRLKKDSSTDEKVSILKISTIRHIIAAVHKGSLSPLRALAEIESVVQF